MPPASDNFEHPTRGGPAAGAIALPAQGGRNAALWLIGVALAFIAAGIWLRPADSWLPSALAQNQTLAGARGVYAFTGQLDANRYGLFMLDVDQGTIWCYDLDSAGGTRKLRLIAARTWVYDRFLQDYNNAKPDFRDVQQLVTQQRQTASSAAPAAPRSADARIEPPAVAEPQPQP